MNYIREELFFRAFFAACFQHGLRYVSTTGSTRHQAFRQSLEHLQKSDVGQCLPRFIPTPIFGQYKELDLALVQLLKTEGGTFHSVKIPDWTRRFLDELPPLLKEALIAAAQPFCQHLTAPV